MWLQSELLNCFGLSFLALLRLTMIQKILVALDGSLQAGKALDFAIDLARAFNAELLVIHVISNQPLTEGERRLAESEYQAEVQQALSTPELTDTPGFAPATVEGLLRTSYSVGMATRTAIGRQIVEHAEEDARSRRLDRVRTILSDGDPASVIVETAEAEKPDLIIMGSRGLGGIQRLLVGSVSHKVSNSTSCSIALIK
jgi:nucleotide-binding universal stress UspA family protein